MDFGAFSVSLTDVIVAAFALFKAIQKVIAFFKK